MRNINELELFAVVGGCGEDSADAEAVEVVAVADDSAEVDAIDFFGLDDSSED